MHLFDRFIFYLFIVIFFSCHTGRQDILLKISKEQNQLLNQDSLLHQKYKINQDYCIKPGDYLQVTILNSDYNYMQGINGAATSGNMQVSTSNSSNTTSGSGNTNTQQSKTNFNTYLVESDGKIRLPLIDLVRLEGMTIRSASYFLEKCYSDYYKNIFISVQVLNRRVTVLGETKQGVFYLKNENTTLMELLSDIGGLSKDAKSQNIRIVRGDLKDPIVMVIDLSTVEGMQKANLTVAENDVIYIEPVKKITFDIVKEIEPIMSILTTSLLIWGIFFLK